MTVKDESVVQYNPSAPLSCRHTDISIPMSALSLSTSGVASQRAVMRGSTQGASLRRAAVVPLRAGKAKAVSLNTVAEGELLGMGYLIKKRPPQTCS